MKRKASRSVMNQFPWTAPSNARDGTPGPADKHGQPNGPRHCSIAWGTQMFHGCYVRHLSYGTPVPDSANPSARPRGNVRATCDGRGKSGGGPALHVVCNARRESRGLMPASEYPEGSDLRQSNAYDSVFTLTLPMERLGRSHGPTHVREAGCDDAISDGSKEQEVAPPSVQVPSRCCQRQAGMR